MHVIRGSGVWLEDSDGARYLDAISGTFNLSLGYNHPHVVAAVQIQLSRIAHVNSDFTNQASMRLRQMLLDLAPDGIGACWLRDLTGSTAIECAVKIAQKATGATEVISFFHAHHGQTYLAASISGPAFRRQSFPSMATNFALRVPTPYCYRCFYAAQFPQCQYLCIERIDDFIKYAASGSIACIIVEPILGNGGNIVPPEGYFERLVTFCRKRGILIVADEVQTGIGRTGYMFASGALGLAPDILVTAKGLGGIGLPIGVVLMKPELDVLDRHEHSFTSGANPLSVAAAIATLEVVSEPHFLCDVRTKGAQLGAALQALPSRHRSVGNVRGMGLMWGIEMVGPSNTPDNRMANRIVEIAKRRHQLVLRSSEYGHGNVLKVRPALVIADGEIAELTARLERSISDAESENEI